MFSQSSFTHPNDAFVVRAEEVKSLERAILNSGDNLKDAEQAGKRVKLDRVTNFSDEGLKGKNLSDGEEFWFKGAKDKHVQGWALKPRGWKEGDKKKWPAVLLIHGGQFVQFIGTMSRSYTPFFQALKALGRTNGPLVGIPTVCSFFMIVQSPINGSRLVFTQQGYFVIMINPTGSTTFGQEFTDAIAEDWGGKPFVDMINGWKHALHQFPEIDANRAVAAGASWGGYAIKYSFCFLTQGHYD